MKTVHTYLPVLLILSFLCIELHIRHTNTQWWEYNLQDEASLCLHVSNSVLDTSNKQNLPALSQTIAIKPSRPLPTVCDNPPSLHCCYRGHHVNCFHKGSRGMSRVLDFLASPSSSGSSYSAAVSAEEMAPELCWEYGSTHIMWQLTSRTSSSGNEKWSWVGKPVH